MKELSKIFGKFAGRSFPVQEVLNNNTPIHVEPLNNPEPVIAEMEQVAKDFGFVLRFRFPGSASTPDFRYDRVNVDVEKASPGIWKISGNFDLG